MNGKNSNLQSVLYPVFLVTCTTAAVLGLLVIWGVKPSALLVRILGTCVVVAVAAALTLSATGLVAGRPPEDSKG